MTGPLIRGSVDSPEGPVAFAAVYLESAPAPTPDVAVMTGADGGFVLAGVGPGHYRLGVHAPGHDPRHVDLDVGDEDVVVHVRIP
ncbi:carboxypeptidase regulatory-like domain-containing protein [Nocardia higoensis]|uniref:Carboxypeptidase regulatory-like domain-containing protein n=1 Tax=Nocardia higoensis TaxID=228599 RepID=A0ABS0D403_9NOCA|nr:carboxypeptidase-like regulatory domain-containing protein [Nocardia higoensis]MBF6353051.1 carboxypeptidase regulatory-like domain-containing protein [Nocardia higoensis]